MLGALVRHLARLRPDVVLCFQHYGNTIGALAARLAGARTIIANRTSAKVLEPRWTRLLDLTLGTTGVFSNVVVNSKEIEDEYRQYPRRYRARVARIDHGFESKSSELGQAAARKVFALPAGITLLGSVARLHPLKNLDAAIRLLVIHPDWHLALAGQGPAHAQLESLAKSLGVLDRLHLMGELSPAQIAIFLRTLDVFVFPSRAESFGLAVVEAAQAGIPVVANDLSVLREVLAIEGEPCALFVDTANPANFAAAVQRLLDDGALRQLTARGRELSQRYSPDVMVADYLALIETGACSAAGRAMTDLAGSYLREPATSSRARQPLRQRKAAATRPGRNAPQERPSTMSRCGSIHRNCATCISNWRNVSPATPACASASWRGAPLPLPSSVDLLLQFECLTLRLSGRRLGDRLAPAFVSEPSARTSPISPSISAAMTTTQAA